MQDVLTAAIEMHQTGQLRPAAQLYQKVLAHEQENADALHLLGVLRHQQGDHAKAVELIRRAIAMRPSVPAFHANLAEAYRSQGQFDRAAGSCRMALPRSSRPTRAGRGRQRAEDRNTEVRFERVGGCCSSHCSGIRFEERAEAIACYERVLALKPDRAATHNSLGWALQEEGRLAEAAEHYHTALRLDPDLGGAQLNIGGVHEELGELTEAESAFRAALRMQPRFALAHARLAMLLRGKLPDADFTALEQRLADPKVSGEPRAALLFGLAQILDGRGEYARAADCLREAPRRSAVRWQRGGDGGKGGSSAARRVRGLSGWPRSAWKGGICQAPVCQVGGWPPEGGKGVNWL